MQDIERKLRESLRARAEDVEPTPMLWERVQERIRRDRWWSWSLALAGTAAAVLLAVVVVPAILPDGREVEILDPAETPTVAGTPTPSVPATEAPEGSPSPTQSETADGVAPGSMPVVVTDGSRIDLVTGDGELVRSLATLPAEGESTVVALAVRPGSTPDDLTVVFSTEAEGMVDLRYLTVRGDEVTGPVAFPQPYQVTPGTVADGALAPVFSPDGRHLAWLEVPRGEPQQPATLRTIGWTGEGPGTGATSSDNAAFGLEPVDTEFPLSLEDWIWEEVGEDGAAAGELRIVGPAGLYHVTIVRQADGALALPADAVRLGDAGGAALIDVEDVHVGDEAHPIPSPGPEYQLLAGGDGSQDAEGIEFTLLRQPAGGPTSEWPLPDLGATADPYGAWMTASPDAAVVGFAGQAWVVTADGAQALPGRVVWADTVR